MLPKEEAVWMGGHLAFVCGLLQPSQALLAGKRVAQGLRSLYPKYWASLLYVCISTYI